jgi:hypothetical protein
MFNRSTSSAWLSLAIAVLLGTHGCSAGNTGQSGPSGSGTNASGGSGTGTGTGSGSGSDVSGATTGAPGSGVAVGAASGSGASTGASASSGLAASGAVDAGAEDATSEAGQTPLQPFVCTELIGLWVASQWWGPFYAAVNKAHWQFMFQHHGYLELFSDPASPYWNNAIMSPCPTGSKAPDRIVFLPFSLTLMTLTDWQTQLTKVVETIKGKFPGVKRIELITTIRGPANMTCAGNTDPFTIVAPYVDQAIQMVADQSGGLVTVGPKIEVANCGWWAGSSHDLTGAGNTGVGKLYADYYNVHP